MSKFKYIHAHVKYIIAATYQSGHDRRRELNLANNVKIITRIEQLFGKKLHYCEVDIVPEDEFTQKFLYEMKEYFNIDTDGISVIHPNHFTSFGKPLPIICGTTRLT